MTVFAFYGMTVFALYGSDTPRPSDAQLRAKGVLPENCFEIPKYEVWQHGWARNGAAIPSATTRTYTPSPADRGAALAYRHLPATRGRG